MDLFREMTFNGTTKESQDERREELDRSAAEFDEIMKLPEEEREERLIPWETIKEEIGFEDTRTDEEKQTDLMRMYRDSIWCCAKKEECIRIYKESRN